MCNIILYRRLWAGILFMGLHFISDPLLQDYMRVSKLKSATALGCVATYKKSRAGILLISHFT